MDGKNLDCRPKENAFSKKLNKNEIEKALDPKNYLGTSLEQVEKFLSL